MKIIALYLPQFHTFPENDSWWGEGYTEWTAVKKASPVYKGHVQPVHPRDGYYDLVKDQPETFKRQAELAEENGIYGFAFYQYYFKGKLLMEKPLEILLSHPEIRMNYCLSWANETWTRTWYGLDEEILMKQEYGDEKDWREHFDHCLPFFKDERYIKKDNKPLFLIYRTFDIPCLKEMKEVWEKYAREEGFDGIYWTGGKTAGTLETREELLDGWYYFEPGYTLKHDMGRFRTFLYNGFTFIRTWENKLLHRNGGKILERGIPIDWIYERITARKYAENEFPGILAEWDNTPRRGYKGLIYTGADPLKFKEALKKLTEKLKGREGFIFLNAWNEWGEGAMVEPTVEKGDAYLRAIREVIR